MRKKMIRILTTLFLCVCLTSCWDYKGLDELTFVAGIAIDEAEGGAGYRVSFEVIDTQVSMKEGEMRSILVESEGMTIYDAIYKTNKQLYHYLYFGNTELLVISHQLAEKEGLKPILEGFLRDASTRDTMLVENTPIDYLDFASPVSGLGSKMGLDATNKWPGETTREWGRPITMPSEVRLRVQKVLDKLA